MSEPTETPAKQVYEKPRIRKSELLYENRTSCSGCGEAQLVEKFISDPKGSLAGVNLVFFCHLCGHSWLGSASP